MPHQERSNGHNAFACAPTILATVTWCGRPYLPRSSLRKPVRHPVIRSMHVHSAASSPFPVSPKPMDSRSQYHPLSPCIRRSTSTHTMSAPPLMCPTHRGHSRSPSPDLRGTTTAWSCQQIRRGRHVGLPLTSRRAYDASYECSVDLESTLRCLVRRGGGPLGSGLHRHR